MGRPGAPNSPSVASVFQCVEQRKPGGRWWWWWWGWWGVDGGGGWVGDRK